MEEINIQKSLPQDYPFIFIDKVLELEAGKRILCQKNLTVNEPVFKGHFPDMPIFPGVLIIEAMAQSSIILFQQSNQTEVAGDKVFLLVKTESHFLHPVFPGDLLLVEVTAEKIRLAYATVSCQVRVGETQVATAKLKFAVAPKSKLSRQSVSS